MMIPKDIRKNLEWRAMVVEKASRDSSLAGVLREVAFRDLLFFVNGFGWLFNPFDEIKHPPFITYPFQDEALLKINGAIETGENVFIDKSRDMGATWMVDMIYLWRWLSKPGEQFRLGSRKEDYVDKAGDMSTHFEKLRFALDRLPVWLRPVGFDRRKNSTYMRLINPENGNAIIGEATNKDFARGGREKSILFDEFQSWEMADEAWKAATDASRCKIALGTPDGAGNKFAELSRTDEVKVKIRLWWYLHPKKSVTSPEHLERVRSGQVYSKKMKSIVVLGDQSSSPSGCYVDVNGKIRSEWYDREDSDRAPDDLASNVDIDYLTSGHPIFDTLKCEKQRILSESPLKVGDLMWKTRPIYSPDTGYVLNGNQLEVEFIPNINGLYYFWEDPLDGFQNGYAVGADTAEGLEQGDYDSAYVLKRFGERPKIVASLHGHLPIHEYAEELAKLAVYYKRACVAIERNNHGHGVINQIVKIYNNLWHKEIFTKGYAEVTDRIGWETSGQSKPIMLGTLGKAISNEEFVCKDESFWKETLTFVEDDGKMEAQGKSKGQRCYDDRVMSMGIVLQTHLNMPLPSMVREKRKSLYRWQSQKQESLVGWTV